MATKSKTTCSIQIRSLSIGQIRPNDYNPNRMPDNDFAELVAEVRHLGRIPKPVVVRESGDDFEIVDGEHGYRAAKECGFTEVPCEIVDAGDFEAMRQTYKRNQHGEHNPVLEGLMFRSMLAGSDLSQRELAKKIKVSEGKIRNAILYADASDLPAEYAKQNPKRYAAEIDGEVRNGYAPGEDSVLAGMPIRSVRYLLRGAVQSLVPCELWGLWLRDSRIDIHDPEDDYFVDSENYYCVSLDDAREAYSLCREHGLWKFFDEAGCVDRKTIKRFTEALTGIPDDICPGHQELMIRLIQCSEFDSRLVDDDMGLSFTRDEEHGFNLLVPADDYFKAIVRLCQQAKNRQQFCEALRLWTALEPKNQGLTGEDKSHPYAKAINARLQQFPEQIRERLSELSLQDRDFLMDVHGAIQQDGHTNDEATELIHEAAGSYLGLQFGIQQGILPDDEHTLDLKRITRFLIEKNEEQQREKQIRSFQSDDANYINAIVDYLKFHDAIASSRFGEQSAEEFIRDRFSKLKKPELRLLGSLLLPDLQDDAAKQWYEHVINEIAPATEDAEERKPVEQIA